MTEIQKLLGTLGGIAILVLLSGTWGWRHGAESVRAQQAKVEQQNQIKHTTQIDRAAGVKESEHEALSTFLSSTPVRAVFLQHCPPVQTTPPPGAGTSAPSPDLQPVPGGDPGVGAVREARDIGPMQRLLAARADETSSDLRESQSVE